MTVGQLSAQDGIKTSLNLRTRRVYHPWMDLNGGAGKPNEIKLDEY